MGTSWILQTFSQTRHPDHHISIDRPDHQIYTSTPDYQNHIAESQIYSFTSTSQNIRATHHATDHYRIHASHRSQSTTCKITSRHGYGYSSHFSHNCSGLCHIPVSVCVWKKGEMRLKGQTELDFTASTIAISDKHLFC